MKAAGKSTNGKWPEVSFGEIFEISSSKRVLEAQWKTSGVPFYRAREIVKLAKEGTVQNELFISEELYREYQAKYGVPKPGDLMISAVGTLGACYVVQPNDRFYYKDASVLRFSPKQPICSRFIQHAFGTNHILDQVHAGSGSTVGTYTISRANETHIPLPPLAEQRRIAEVLDRAEALRAKRRAALAQLDSLTQSIFLDLFGKPKDNPKGWPLVALMELCSPKQWPTISTAQLTESGYPVFGANGQIGFYTEFNHEHPTVLVTCRGATCGTVNVCPPRCYVTGNAMALDDPDSERIELTYLEHVLRHRDMGDVISGTAQPQITRQGLQPVRLPLPPLAQQREFARRVTAVEKLKAAQRASLAELDALFATLQHRAFRGEL